MKGKVYRLRSGAPDYELGWGSYPWVVEFGQLKIRFGTIGDAWTWLRKRGW